MNFLSTPQTFAIRVLIACIAMTVTTNTATAETTEVDAQALVGQAYVTYQAMSNGNTKEPLVTLMREARAIMIFPEVVKGALIFGGEGGKGVMLARDSDGVWSHPAFYGMGSVSFGLQGGISAYQFMMIIMSDKALQNLLGGEFKIGGDAGITLIEIGTEGEISTTATRNDIYYYAESKAGLYVGISLEGSNFHTRDSYNRAYYGDGVLATHILLDRSVSNEGADQLRNALP